MSDGSFFNLFYGIFVVHHIYVYSVFSSICMDVYMHWFVLIFTSIFKNFSFPASARLVDSYKISMGAWCLFLYVQSTLILFMVCFTFHKKAYGLDVMIGVGHLKAYSQNIHIEKRLTIGRLSISSMWNPFIGLYRNALKLFSSVSSGMECESIWG